MKGCTALAAWRPVYYLKPQAVVAGVEPFVAEVDLPLCEACRAEAERFVQADGRVDGLLHAGAWAKLCDGFIRRGFLPPCPFESRVEFVPLEVPEAFPIRPC